LIERYGKKGFVILAITGEPESETKKFIEETKLAAPVVFEKTADGKVPESMKAFGFEGLPSSALIGPKGEVLWTGHPSGLTEKIIEEHLAGVKPPAPSAKLAIECDLPKKYAPTAKMLSSGRVGEGRNALAKALEAKDLKEGDKPQLEAAVAEVDALIERELLAATTAASEKRYFDAQAAWKRISAACRGHDAGKTADTKLAELGKDAALKKEIEAGARIAEAQKLAEAGKTKQALGVLTALGDGYLKDTEEAKRAKALAEELKKA
jgi:hypothetical protein